MKKKQVKYRAGRVKKNNKGEGGGTIRLVSRVGGTGVIRRRQRNADRFRYRMQQNVGKSWGSEKSLVGWKSFVRNGSREGVKIDGVN